MEIQKETWWGALRDELTHGLTKSQIAHCQPVMCTAADMSVGHAGRQSCMWNSLLGCASLMKVYGAESICQQLKRVNSSNIKRVKSSKALNKI